MSDKLTSEQIKELEATLTNFITKLKASETSTSPSAATMMMKSGGGAGRGHGSHYME